jgi:hypothetical protein
MRVTLKFDDHIDVLGDTRKWKLATIIKIHDEVEEGRATMSEETSRGGVTASTKGSNQIVPTMIQ